MYTFGINYVEQIVLEASAARARSGNYASNLPRYRKTIPVYFEIDLVNFENV
jgi:hypothetical protein